MILFSTSNVQANGQMLSCDDAALTNPAGDAPKQCFCEPNPSPQPYSCAEHGGDCSCPKDSIVVYGALNHPKKAGKLAKYKNAIHSHWTAAFMGNRDSIKCDSSSFGGVDPLPAASKQCFCDEKKITGVEAAQT